MLAALHSALTLPSGIIFDDESPEARAQARTALRAQGMGVAVWNTLQVQGSGARAAARERGVGERRGSGEKRGSCDSSREKRGSNSSQNGAAPASCFHLMPSDLVVLKMDLPQVRSVLHFEVPRRELSIYGLRLMCLEQQQDGKSKGAGSQQKRGPGGRSLSVLFVEAEDVVRELEKLYHIRMQTVPTEMLRRA